MAKMTPFHNARASLWRNNKSSWVFSLIFCRFIFYSFSKDRVGCLNRNESWSKKYQPWWNVPRRPSHPGTWMGRFHWTPVFTQLPGYCPTHTWMHEHIHPIPRTRQKYTLVRIHTIARLLLPLPYTHTWCMDIGHMRPIRRKDIGSIWTTVSIYTSHGPWSMVLSWKWGPCWWWFTACSGDRER